MKAGNEHSVHSPFVFDLLTKLIYNRVEYYSFKKIENLREELLDSKKIIVKHTVESAKYTQLLFRLVNYFQPSQIIELGTSVGISAAYLASVSSKINIITIESRQKIAEIARENFEKLELKNIEQIVNNSDKALPTLLDKYQILDFVHFAGNNGKQATLNHFKQCLEKANGDSVFVFDNIYCSSEMKETWNEIKNNNRVRVTVDLFFMGIVFFRQEQVKQHFVIKY
jgi:predicted O-methyltransferase YrrM